MEAWWKQRFIDRRAWILDHLEQLAINGNEALCLSIIDFLNEHQIPVSHSILAQKLKLESGEIDDLLTTLQTKGCLSIEYRDKGILFDITGTFEGEKASDSLRIDTSLFELFEEEFARPLTQNDLQTMSEWIQEYDQKLIAYALREALTYEHLNFDYIDRILKEWKRKNFQAKDYEDGKR